MSVMEVSYCFRGILSQDTASEVPLQVFLQIVILNRLQPVKDLRSSERQSSAGEPQILRLRARQKSGCSTQDDNTKKGPLRSTSLLDPDRRAVGQVLSAGDYNPIAGFESAQHVIIVAHDLAQL